MQIFKKHKFREKVVITPQSSHLPLSNSWGTLARTYPPQRDQCAVLTSPCELSVATHQPPIKGYRQVFPDNIYCTPAMCRRPISDSEQDQHGPAPKGYKHDDQSSTGCLAAPTGQRAHHSQFRPLSPAREAFGIPPKPTFPVCSSSHLHLERTSTSFLKESCTFTHPRSAPFPRAWNALPDFLSKF